MAYEASHKYTLFHTFYYFSTQYAVMYPAQRGLYALRGSVNHTFVHLLSRYLSFSIIVPYD